MKFAIFGIAISTSFLFGHIANAALISSAAQKDPNVNQAAGASNIHTLERRYAANIQIQSLPDGDYLFSELSGTDAQGSNVVVFRKRGNLIAGDEWTNNTDSGSCFGATLNNNHLTNVYSITLNFGYGGYSLDREDTLNLQHYLQHQYTVDSETKKRLNDCLNSLNNFTESFKVLSSAQFYKEQGDTHYDQRSWPQAITAYTEALSLSPRYAAIYYNRGMAHHYNGQNQQAIADLQTAVQLYKEQGKTADHQDTLQQIAAIQKQTSEPIATSQKCAKDTFPVTVTTCLTDKSIMR
jgi:tetratricopeptide (TPR) repeat protein